MLSTDKDLTSIFYRPEEPKGEVTSEYLLRELRRISAAFELIAQGHNPIQRQAPVKPTAGMIVIADGTAWNPGAGAGAYEYKGGAWVKL